jgi:hypothetical protein
MAKPKRSPNCSYAAPPRPSRTATGNTALRRIADRPHRRARVQADAEARRGTCWAARQVPGGGEPGASTGPHVGLLQSLDAPPTASCPCFPRQHAATGVPPALGVGARRSGREAQPPTRRRPVLAA